MSSTEFLRRSIRERDLPGVRSALEGGAPVDEAFPPSRKNEPAMTPVMLVLDDLVSGTESNFIEGWKSKPVEVSEVLVRHGAKLENQKIDILRNRLRTRFKRLCGLSTPDCQEMHEEFDLRLRLAVDDVLCLMHDRNLTEIVPPVKKGSPPRDYSL